MRGNTAVQFDGWETGETLRDYWTGHDDNRWFYYINNGQKTRGTGIILRIRSTPLNKTTVYLNRNDNNMAIAQGDLQDV